MADCEKILWFIKNGDLAELKKATFSIDEVEADGRPAIIIAADYGQTEVVKYLIERGANVNAVDRHGITALLAAVWENHVSTVDVLLQKGADKNVRSPAGTSAREEAENDKIKALLD